LGAVAVVVAAVGFGFCPRHVAAEPLKLTLGADIVVPLSAPQNSEFLPGAQATFGVLMPLAPKFLVGGRLGLGALMNGPAPADSGRVDPGLGGLVTAQVVGRVRPLADAVDPRRGIGLFVDVNAGGVITGALVRPTLGLGVGWGFALGDLTFAPSLRYQQVIQGTDPIDSRDARLLLLGVELILGEVAPAPPPLPPPTDRDGDGLMDDVDRCPDNPEDYDGFEDADGCPDPDNDQDGVLDVSDACVNEPEDKDGFEDADGCPDLDNDRDGFLDPNDECPNDAEVVNGITDYDGCPDVGLITMIDDRIILEERVLFDFERARIKSKAKPVLQAIVTLQQQHPEWISVRVEGHADARGDAAFNQDLSDRRAANVRQSLVDLGIPTGMIDSVGYGATRLRDMRETEEGHQYNRRVEFVVVARRHETTGVVAPAAAAPTSSATPAATPAEPAAAPAEPAAVTEDEATP
jgi:outer membrane protein OmpA-like peptidoglycan-associated protein